MSQTAEQIMIAHHMGMQHIVVFMNKCDMVDDMEMLELVEMEIRDQLYQCGFVGSDIPFIYGSALKALEGPDGEWGDKIMELMDAVDKYIPDSQSEIDQASSIHTKFTAEVYMLDINEGGRDTGYFDGDRLQFYFKTTEILKSAKNAKGKKIVVKWKKNTAGNGYQIQYSTSKKFAKGNKTKTISKNKTTSYTIKKLKKKKTYYVRIRTYKKVSGKTYYSEWSSVKKVKIKK